MESRFKDHTVCVTGGLGLIGSFLCDELLEAGARVVLVDDESKGSWRHVLHLRSRVHYRKGNLENPVFARNAIDGCDAVFHLASRVYGVGFSHKNNFEMFRFNDLINTNVLDAIAAHRPSQALVVSSSCVYPDDGPTPMSDAIPITGEPESVNWGYGWAKRILEQKAIIYQRETGIPITVVRPFNVYGERYLWVGDSSQAIPMLAKRVLDGENPVVVWGTGNQQRNYVHALDCARVMLRLMQNGYCERPVNIGGEETITVRALVERLAAIAGIEVAVVADRSKPEGRFIKSADRTRLTAALGDDFEWQVGLREGLERMIGWYHKSFPTGERLGAAN